MKIEGYNHESKISIFFAFLSLYTPVILGGVFIMDHIFGPDTFRFSIKLLPILGFIFAIITIILGKKGSGIIALFINLLLILLSLYFWFLPQLRV